MADSEYQKRQDGDSTVFEVTPATAPKAMYPIVWGAILILLLGILLPLNTDHPSLFKSWAIAADIAGAVAIYLGWNVDGRPSAHQSRTTFRVTSSAIETNGQTFAKNDIHRIVINNGITKNVLRASHQASLGGMVSGMSNADGKLVTARGLQLAPIAHSLELETGGKAYVLAGGMNQTTAFGLLTDVNKIIGFESGSV